MRQKHFLVSLIQAWHLETSPNSPCYTTVPTEGWISPLAFPSTTAQYAFISPLRLCSLNIHSSVRSAQSSRIIKSVQTLVQLLAFEKYTRTILVIQGNPSACLVCAVIMNRNPAPNSSNVSLSSSKICSFFLYSYACWCEGEAPR